MNLRRKLFSILSGLLCSILGSGCSGPSLTIAGKIEAAQFQYGMHISEKRQAECVDELKVRPPSIYVDGIYGASGAMTGRVAANLLIFRRLGFVELHKTDADDLLKDGVPGQVSGSEGLLRFSLTDDKGSCFKWNSDYYNIMSRFPARPDLCLRVEEVERVTAKHKIDVDVSATSKMTWRWEISDLKSGEKLVSLPFWAPSRGVSPKTYAEFFAMPPHEKCSLRTAYATALNFFVPTSIRTDAEQRPLSLDWKYFRVLTDWLTAKSYPKAKEVTADLIKIGEDEVTRLPNVAWPALYEKSLSSNSIVVNVNGQVFSPLDFSAYTISIDGQDVIKQARRFNGKYFFIPERANAESIRLLVVDRNGIVIDVLSITPNSGQKLPEGLRFEITDIRDGRASVDFIGFFLTGNYGDHFKWVVAKEQLISFLPYW